MTVLADPLGPRRIVAANVEPPRGTRGNVLARGGVGDELSRVGSGQRLRSGRAPRRRVFDTRQNNRGTPGIGARR